MWLLIYTFEIWSDLGLRPRLQALILPGGQADEINRVAIEQGMVPITQAALKLARAGLISLSQAWRARAE